MERETQGKNERDMKGKEKGKEAVGTDVVHSGLFEIIIIFFYLEFFYITVVFPST